LNTHLNTHLDLHQYSFFLNGKLLSQNQINEFIVLDTNIKNHHLICFPKQLGGDFTDVIGFIFNPLFKPIETIGNIFMLLIKFIIWFFKFLYWFFFFIAWVFSDLLNPIKLTTDFLNGIKLILYSILTGILNIFMSLFALVINNLSDWIQGFWGWDQTNLTQSDKDSNYFKSIDRNKGKKCYVTDGNTVPFSVILGTVLCPPLGVFMDMGATGWLNIVICALLTLLFYLPGLCYALLVIYT
jgi:uncharacterized membrane protein YqaE (UPF0057 family)